MKMKKVYYPLYLFFFTSAIIMLFEFVILPWHLDLPRNMALMGFAGKPNTILDDTSLNSMGFTGDVIGDEKDPDKIRVLTLGGSAMFNRQMTRRLKESLDKISERPVEVVGAALRTHTSMASVIKYRALAKYEFDYVMIYHGINDLFVNHVYVDHFRNDYSHMVPWYKRNRLLDHSLIIRIFYNNYIWARRIFGMEKIWYIYPEEHMENAMDFVSERLFKRNMTELIKEIKKNGAVPVLMTFAWNMPDHYNQTLFESGGVGYKPTEYGRYPVELWGSIGFVREGLQRHNRVIRDIAARHGVYLIDQENLMRKDLLWFEDVCHFSPEGTAEFIRNIRSFFTENKLMERVRK